MSIFTLPSRMVDSIVKGLIKRRLKKTMKNLQPVLDFLFKVVDKYGTKFVIALGGIAAVFWLSFKGELDPLYACIGIVVMVVAYMWARRAQETDQCPYENGDVEVEPTNTEGR